MNVENVTRFNPETGTNWAGELLQTTDPRAWEGTIAFHERPSQDELEKHLEYCIREGLATRDAAGLITLNDGTLPVLYPFGVRWDSAEDLLPEGTSAEGRFPVVHTQDGLQYAFGCPDEPIQASMF